jgi:Zn-finger nucleic acid-binding protein
MQPNKSPDITIDECAACGGAWLDAGELNTLATGLAGNIELCTVKHTIVDADAPERHCPLCDGPLITVGMLGSADVVLDHCQDCAGFYLDRGEVGDMNAELRRISRAEGGDEYRGSINGHLVRVDRQTASHIRHDLLGVAFAAVEEQSLTIAVYFSEPVGTNLRVYAETLSSKVAKVLRLFAPQDLQMDDPEVDKAFLVQGDDSAAVRQAFSEPVRKRMLQFRADAPKIYTKPGSLELLDDRVVYTEGPYSMMDDNPWRAGLTYDADADPASIVTALIRIAKLVDEARA